MNRHRKTYRILARAAQIPLSNWVHLQETGDLSALYDAPVGALEPIPAVPFVKGMELFLNKKDLAKVMQSQKLQGVLQAVEAEMPDELRDMKRVRLALERELLKAKKALSELAGDAKRARNLAAAVAQIDERTTTGAGRMDIMSQVESVFTGLGLTGLDLERTSLAMFWRMQIRLKRKHDTTDG